MTALMQVFFEITQVQEPNPEWEEKLEQGSEKFREMKDKDKATSWISPKVEETPTAKVVFENFSG